MSYTFGCRKQGCAWRLFCRCHKIALNNMYEHCNQIKPSMVQTWIGSTSNGQTLAYPCPRRTTLSFARALWVYDLLITIKITTLCHWPIPPRTPSPITPFRPSALPPLLNFYEAILIYHQRASRKISRTTPVPHHVQVRLHDAYFI